jgi:hypothetical protein
MIAVHLSEDVRAATPESGDYNRGMGLELSYFDKQLLAVAKDPRVDRFVVGNGAYANREARILPLPQDA